MTTTKATGPLVVLEAAFKVLPGKETEFLAYQTSVVPLAMARDGFRAAYGGPLRNSVWVYFGARFGREEQMNAWQGDPQHRVIQKSAPNWWAALYLRKWRPADAGRSPRRSPDVGSQDPRRYRARPHADKIGAAGAGGAKRRRSTTY
jgi:hypothetical protein